MSSHRFEKHYAGQVTSLAAARRDVAAFLEGCGAGPDLIERARLVVSELASNAIEASPGRSYDIVVESLAHDRRARISVTNRSDAPLPVAAEVGPTALRGRGLHIVETLSSGVRVEREGPRIVVTSELAEG